MASEDEIQLLQGKLKKIGWHVSLEGVAQCCQSLGQGKCTVENVIKSAVHCDLKDIGSSILSEDVKRGRATSIEGPIVLQIQKIRNVSAPKANEESSGAPRLLKLQLTDGHTTCFALENSSIPHFSLSTPPGTKVRLKGTIPMFIGFMLLEPCFVEKLGGQVEKLVTKWETNRNVTEQRSQVGLGGEGPPSFVPFDVKTSGSTFRKPSNDKPARTSHEPAKSTQQQQQPGQRNNKKTEEQTGGYNKNQRAESARFDDKDKRAGAHRGPRRDDQTRGNQAPRNHGLASENKSGGKPKSTFDSNNDIRSQWRENTGTQHGRKTGPPDFQNDRKDNYKQRNEYQADKRGGGQRNEKGRNDERGRNDRRGARYDDDDHDVDNSRPSQGTLWDFLEKRIPVKEKGANKKTRNNEIKDKREYQDYRAADNQSGSTAGNEPINMRMDNKHGTDSSLDAGRGTRQEQEHVKQRFENDNRQRKDAQNNTGRPFDRKHEAVLHEKPKSGKQNERSTYSRETNKKNWNTKSDSKTGSKQVSREREGGDDGGKTYKENKQQNAANRSDTTQQERQYYKEDQPRNKKASQAQNRETGEGGRNRTTGPPAGKNRSIGTEYNSNRTPVDNKEDRRPSSNRTSDTGRNSNWNSKQDTAGEKKMDFDRRDDGAAGERQQKPHLKQRQDNEAENASQRNYSRKENRPKPGAQAEHASQRKTGCLKDDRLSNIEQDDVTEQHRGQKRNDGTRNERNISDDKPSGEHGTIFPSDIPAYFQPMNRNQGQHTAKHWWERGEQCMALCSVDRQHYIAIIVSVEVQARSCVVFFEHTDTTETVHWANLLPLDGPNRYNEQMFPAPSTANPSFFQQPLHPYAMPIMQDRWIASQPAPFQQYFPNGGQLMHNNPVPGGHVNRPHLQRPSQAFYRPPTGRRQYPS